MAASRTTERPWIGDLFATCWDRLTRDDVSRIITTGLGAGLDPVITHLDASLRRAPDGRAPADVLDYLGGAAPIGWGASAEHGDPTRHFLVAWAIDRLLADIRPFAGRTRAPLPASLRSLADQYRRSGKYNVDAPGVVLPRGQIGPLAPRLDLDGPSNPESGIHTARLFRCLTRSTDTCLSVGRPAPSRDDAALDLDPSRVELAVVPWAEDADALDFTSEVIETIPWVHVRVPPQSDADLARRATDLVSALAERAVTIAVLPEFVVSPAAVRALQAALKAMVRDRSDFALELLVAGSGLSDEREPGCDLAYNECAVLSRRGRVLWTQRKCHQYAMEPATMRTYGLGGVIESDLRHRERFFPGSVIEVRDTRLGRATVFICEDLAQHAPGQGILDAVRPDWLFAPVLDGELTIGRWIHQKAFSIAPSHGTHCVIATSLVLPLRTTPGNTVFNVGLCVGGAFEARDPVTDVVAAHCGPGKVKLLEVDCGHPGPRVAVTRWAPDAWPSTWIIQSK